MRRKWRHWQAHSAIFRVTVTVSAVIAAAVIVWFISAIDPVTAQYYPKCPSRLLFGIECPGCGSARAMHALMHGRVGQAWAYNPALFFFGAVLAAVAVKDFLRPSHAFSRAVRSPWFAGAVAAVVVLWTILRNII